MLSIDHLKKMVYSIKLTKCNKMGEDLQNPLWYMIKYKMHGNKNSANSKSKKWKSMEL